MSSLAENQQKAVTVICGNSSIAPTRSYRRKRPTIRQVPRRLSRRRRNPRFAWQKRHIRGNQCRTGIVSGVGPSRSALSHNPRRPVSRHTARPAVFRIAVSPNTVGRRGHAPAGAKPALPGANCRDVAAGRCEVLLVSAGSTTRLRRHSTDHTITVDSRTAPSSRRRDRYPLTAAFNRSRPSSLSDSQRNQCRLRVRRPQQPPTVRPVHPQTVHLVDREVICFRLGQHLIDDREFPLPRLPRSAPRGIHHLWQIGSISARLRSEAATISNSRMAA